MCMKVIHVLMCELNTCFCSNEATFGFSLTQNDRGYERTRPHCYWEEQNKGAKQNRVIKSPQLLAFPLFCLCLASAVRPVIGGLTTGDRHRGRCPHNIDTIFRDTFNCRCPGSGSEQELRLVCLLNP